MGFKQNRKNSRQIREEESESDEENNETMPIPAMEHLSLKDKHSGDTIPAEEDKEKLLFSFLKNRPIKKRNRNGNQDSRERLKLKMQKMEAHIQELEKNLEEYRAKENSCPHCHFYLNQERKTQRESSRPTPEGQMVDCLKRSTSKDSLEFEKVNFMTPLMCSPEMEEKSWIFLGTMMIAMGSKVIDMDGTLNVFRIVKESVDKIRRQVQKSQQKISLDFFLSTEQFEPETRMQELNFDPFYNKNEYTGGLNLEGIRVESVEQFELFFDQKLCYNVKYDALITVMEYLKENSSISYS